MATRFLIMGLSLLACVILYALTKNIVIGLAGPFVGMVFTAIFGYRKKK